MRGWEPPRTAREQLDRAARPDPTKPPLAGVPGRRGAPLRETAVAVVRGDGRLLRFRLDPAVVPGRDEPDEVRSSPAYPGLQASVTDDARRPVRGARGRARRTIQPTTGDAVAVAVGLLVALWAGLGVMQSLQVAFNTIWGIPRDEQPTFARSRLRSLLSWRHSGSSLLDLHRPAGGPDGARSVGSGLGPRVRRLVRVRRAGVPARLPRAHQRPAAVERRSCPERRWPPPCAWRYRRWGWSSWNAGSACLGPLRLLRCHAGHAAVDLAPRAGHVVRSPPERRAGRLLGPDRSPTGRSVASSGRPSTMAGEPGLANERVAQQPRRGP